MLGLTRLGLVERLRAEREDVEGVLAAPVMAALEARSTSDRPGGHSGRSGYVPGVEGLESCRIPASRWPRTFFRSFLEAMLSAACDLLDPQVVDVVPGTHAPSGVFQGVQAVAAHLSTFLRLTEDPIDVLKWEDWMAGVDNVAGLAKIHLQREGQQHDFRVIFLVSVTEDDGLHRISRIESFYSDQAAFDRFFSVEP